MRMFRAQQTLLLLAPMCTAVFRNSEATNIFRAQQRLNWCWTCGGPEIAYGWVRREPKPRLTVSPVSETSFLISITKSVRTKSIKTFHSD